jgi:type IV pilus assembly protein PilY1
VSQAVLWDFTNTYMGLSYSVPVAVSTTAGFAIVFGVGYDSPINTPILFALNPQTGAIMSEIHLCTSVPAACNAALPNGLSSVAAMNTSGLMGQRAVRRGLAG